MLMLWASAALADGLKPGQWKVTTWIAQGGVVGPPQQSIKCLTPEQTHDLATTFSPVSRTINSDCAPLEQSLVGAKLNWKLVCKGQLNMEVIGDFTFDNPRHYIATVATKATMGGMPMVDSRTMLEAEWVSQCD